MTVTTAHHHRIVVLGAGYTGMLAAIRLAHRTRRTGARVTLVNPTARFTERLRLHRTATGQRLADHRVPDLLTGTGVTFVRGTATALDPDTRTVTLDGGAATLSYDTLPVRVRPPGGQPGPPGRRHPVHARRRHPAPRLPQGTGRRPLQGGGQLQPRAVLPPEQVARRHHDCLEGGPRGLGTRETMDP